MKVYCQIEEGICRYLDEWGIKLPILLSMGLLSMDVDDPIFRKWQGRATRTVLIECSREDFNLLFTYSLEYGSYMGDIAEDRITQAFFRYICR